jgi:hypothetical protein
MSGASAGRLRSAPSDCRGSDRMSAERTPMRRVREILRLKFIGDVSIREPPAELAWPPRRCATTIKRFQAAGLTWPLSMTDTALEARLFATAGIKQDHRRQAEPEGGNPSRAQAQAHHAVASVGRAHLRRAIAIPLLRAVLQLGRQALSHHAPDHTSPCVKRSSEKSFPQLYRPTRRSNHSEE